VESVDILTDFDDCSWEDDHMPGRLVDKPGRQNGHSIYQADKYDLEQPFVLESNLGGKIQKISIDKITLYNWYDYATRKIFTTLTGN
jgi:hypothetical protein